MANSPKTSKQWQPRLARESDIPALGSVISLSVRELQSPYYSSAQIEASLGPVFAVDGQLIADQTYFVVEDEGQIAGGGGWCKQRSFFRSNARPPGGSDLLDPARDAARVRAFFVHPAWARRGIGRSLMMAVERQIMAAGFGSADLCATLAGEPLYASMGYSVIERYEIELPGLPGMAVAEMLKRFAR